MLDRVKENNNLLWESARHYFLDAFLEDAYSDAGKRTMLNRWIRGRRSRTFLIRQVEWRDPIQFVSDFLMIEFKLEGAEFRLVDRDENIDADVVLDTTHYSFVYATASFLKFVEALLMREMRVGHFPRNWRDCYYLARLFFT